MVRACARFARIPLVVVIIASLAACSKEAAVPEPKSPTDAGSQQALDKWLKGMSSSTQAAWREDDRLVPLRKEQAAKDRAELVLPALAGFRAGDEKSRIKLTLIPQKAMLRVGERFWYRLELQNVGTEPIRWFESLSFFKSGDRFADGRFRFYVTPPGGGEVEMLGPHPLPRSIGDIKFPAGWTDRQKSEALRRMNDRQKVEEELGVTLAPGETLVTRGWKSVEIAADALRDRWIRGEADPHILPGNFRELPSRYWFSKPGTYRIRVLLADEPLPPQEDEIQALIKDGISRERQLQYHRDVAHGSFGLVGSRPVLIEVVP